MSRIFNRVLNQRLANHGIRICRLEDADSRNAAIFARLDALEADVFAVHGYADRVEVDALAARVCAVENATPGLGWLERLESARIAAPVAPESVETASEVAQEPGNATERLCRVMHDAYETAAIAAGWATNQESRRPWLDVPESNKTAMRAGVNAMLADPEVAAALCMYRKVQSCTEQDGGEVEAAGEWYADAIDLLAWLKEGEA